MLCDVRVFINVFTAVFVVLEVSVQLPQNGIMHETRTGMISCHEIVECFH